MAEQAVEEAKLQEFLELTAGECPEDTARFMLEACAGDVQAALHMFLGRCARVPLRRASERAETPRTTQTSVCSDRAQSCGRRIAQTKRPQEAEGTPISARPQRSTSSSSSVQAPTRCLHGPRPPWDPHQAPMEAQTGEEARGAVVWRAFSQRWWSPSRACPSPSCAPASASPPPAYRWGWAWRGTSATGCFRAASCAPSEVRSLVAGMLLRRGAMMVGTTLASRLRVHLTATPRNAAAGVAAALAGGEDLDALAQAQHFILQFKVR